MKKIHPKQQTAELNKARVEILQRNSEKLGTFKKLFKRNEKKREAFTSELSKLYPDLKIKEAFDLFYSEAFFDDEFKNHVLDANTFPQLPACNAIYWTDGLLMFIESEIMLRGPENLPYMSKDKDGKFFVSKDGMNQAFLDYYTRHAQTAFSELTNLQPLKHLLVGIDLFRGKDVILAEIGEFVTHYQKREGIRVKDERQSWLSKFDVYISMWDQRIKGLSFAEIAKDNKISIDLAHKRFYRAFEIITDQEYSKNIWKELLKKHLERIAKKEKPQDKEFWGRVMKMETARQKDLLQDERIDKKSIDNTADVPMLVRDLTELCLKCPDIGCRNNTIKCLSEFAAGGDNAFDDFKPDCPKFYSYLKP